MRSFLILLLLSALVWGASPVVHFKPDGKGGAAFAKSGSSNDDDDDDDDSGGSGSSGSGSSGSGSSGPGSSGPGSSSSGSATSGGSAGATSGSAPSSASRGANTFGLDGITVRFADGHVERVRGGRFETLDPRGRMVATRAADREDETRLRSFGEIAKRRGGGRQIEAVVEIAERGAAIEVTDFRGWREIVTRGSYVVKDPKGRTVARRPVTAADVIRIRGMFSLD